MQSIQKKLQAGLVLLAMFALVSQMFSPAAVGAAENTLDEETVISTADVSVVKTVDAPTKHVGDTVTYTITAHNAGPSTATGVTVTDLLPSTLTYVSAVPDADYDEATGLWTVGTMANGADSVLTITATVNAGTVGTSILNTTNIVANEDNFLSNNVSGVSLNVVPVPAVDEPGPCVEGATHATGVVSNIQGTLNNGDPITDVNRTDPAKALGVADGQFYSLGKNGVVTLSFNSYVLDVAGTDISVHEITNGRDIYPEEKALVAVSQDGVTFVTVGTASGLDLGTGVSSFDISSTGFPWIKYVRLTDATNFAIHNSTADGYDLDAVDAMYGNCSIVNLSKVGSYDSSTGTIMYTIHWSVVGDQSLPVTITDTLPANTTYVPASADNGGVYDGGMNKITWALGSKPAGSSGDVTFKVTLDAALAMNMWAKTVAGFTQGKQANLVNAVDANRSDSTQALGVAQTAGALYDNPLPDFIGKFVSLGFTEGSTGGQIVVAFDHPVYNGPGNDLQVYEVTSGDNYPDEQVKVSVSDDNATWTDVGVVVRDGGVDLGAVPQANFVRILDTSNKANFEATADGFDVDAVKSLQLVPDVCNIVNTAFGSWDVLVNDVSTTITTSATTTTTINESSCSDEEFSIAGQKWNDVNGNGTKDVGETGLANWTIYVDKNDNGTLDVGETSTATDASGNYTLSGLLAGMYVVREVNQAGWTQTFPTVANLNKHVVFVTTFNITGKDFGNHATQNNGGGGEGGGNNLGSITGLVFNDANNNSALDVGESSLSGWVVYLDANDNGVKDLGEVSTTTASPYLFSNLVDGSYIVREVVQDGWTQTMPVGSKYTIVISGGNSVTDKDFGNHQNSNGGGSGVGSGSGSGGGSGSSSGGGSTGGGATGQVLGSNTNNPQPPAETGGSGEGLSMPAVLGATTLPRTGTGVQVLILVLLAGAGLAYTTRKLFFA